MTSAAAIEATIVLDDVSYETDLAKPQSIAWPLHFDAAKDPSSTARNPNAFGLPHPNVSAVSGEGYKLDVAAGGSVNCFEMNLCAHGSGTHTECRGHISKDGGDIHQELDEGILPCLLVTVKPKRLDTASMLLAGKSDASDTVVSRDLLSKNPLLLESTPFACAVIIRTRSSVLPVPQFTGTNPAYFTVGAIEFLRSRGCRHLLTDLPSIDREDDGGTTPSHHAFFAGDDRRTITEMARLPMNIGDGLYMLDLQIPPFVFESAPSRPRLFRVRKSASPQA